MVIIIPLPPQHEVILQEIRNAGIDISKDDMKDLYDTLLFFSYRLFRDMNFDIMEQHNIAQIFSGKLESFMYNQNAMYGFLEHVLEALKFLSDFILRSQLDREQLIVTEIKSGGIHARTQDDVPKGRD